MTAELAAPRETGVYRGVLIEEYHSGPELSKSGLDQIARCPAAWWSAHRDPKRPPEKERGGQLEGNLAHCAALEPAEFGKRYVVSPDLNRNSNAWKDWLRDELPKGAVAIKPHERRTAFMQAESLRAIPEFAEALTSGAAEESVYWTDDATGVRCRCRPDWTYFIPGRGVILFDVKTYKDASPWEFRRQIASKRYHVQDAFYSEGYAKATGLPVLGFVFLAVEAEWPYLSCPIVIDDQGREQGRIDFRRDLERFAECDRTDTWPGHYTSGMQEVSLPRWAISEENDGR